MEKNMIRAVNPSQYVVTLDDDPMVPKLIERTLGMKSITFTSARKLVNQAGQYSPVAAFIDINLGESESGLDTVPQLRNKWPFCPIIVITVDPSDDAVSNALTAGADDFIHKPIRPKELIARVQVRLNDVAEKESKSTIQVGDLIIDLSHRVLRGKVSERYLSQTEINLLNTLVNAKGSIVSRSTLKRRGWGQVAVSDNALDRKMYEVRQAIKEVSENVGIRTCYGIGFVLETETSVDSSRGFADRPARYGT